MTKMNEKKWGEVLKGLVGSIFNYEDFESDIISMCDTEDVIYIGDFEKRAWKDNEFVGVYEENGNNYILLEVIRDKENETIEVVDGYIK
jgi:hypothetical protein